MASKSESSDDKPSNLTWDMLRVRPEESEDTRFYKTDRMTDLLFILLILGISVWFRFYVRDLYLSEYGTNVYHITIIEGDPLGFGRFLGADVGDEVFTEGYHDFYTYYIPYVEAYNEGWNPYTGSRTVDDDIGGYVYGPFYMISIAIGTTVFGLDPTDSIVFSNILLDGMTYVMVYILAKRVTGNVIALIFALAGSFSPISLFYIAFRGLNAPIMNLSFLIFIWCYLEKKDNLTMFFLAFSLLTKQFPMFMAMPIGFWMVRRYGFFKGVGYYLKFFMWVLLLSIPYILWTPRNYVVRLFLPGGGKAVMDCPENGEATNLFHGFIPINGCYNEAGSVYSSIQTELPALAETIFGLVNSHILFFGSLFIIAWIGFTGYDYLEERPRLYFVFISAYYGIAHATIARGIYKYYLTFIVPLFLLGLIMGNRNKSLHIRLGVLLHQNWKTWLNPKYRQKEATAKFWIYGFTLFVTTFSIFVIVISLTSMFTYFLTSRLLWKLIIVGVTVFILFKPGPKPEIKEQEMIESQIYQIQSFTYLTIAGIMSLPLYHVAMLYFDANLELFVVLIPTVIVVLGLMLIPFLQKNVTGKTHTFSPLTLSFRQLLLDIGGLILVTFVMIYFNRTVLVINRLYTTLFLFFFSFIYLGMLGRSVWSSALAVPVKFIDKILRIRYYANLRKSNTS